MKSTIDYIKINHFKNKKQFIELDLKSNNGITIISGKNGSGKTTFINAISSLLRRDKNLFLQENINSIRFETSTSNGLNDKYTIEFLKEKDKFSIYPNHSANDYFKFIENTKSIAIGSNRGLIKTRKRLNSNEVYDYFIDNDSLSEYSPMEEFNEFTNYLNRMSEISSIDDINLITKKNHLYLDNIDYKYLEKQIEHAFQNISGKFEHNYLTRLVNLIESDSSKKIKLFERSFNDRNNIDNNIIYDYLKFWDSIKLDHTESSSVLSRIEIDKLYKMSKSPTINKNSIKKLNIFTIIALSEYTENSNSYFGLLNLQRKFNKYLDNKKLIYEDGKPLIKFTKVPSSHSIDKLSTGELNLLSILTIVELLNHIKIDFLLIDEISLALDTDWLENLLDDINGDNINQIIVASHSPDLALNQHKSSLKNLEVKYHE